ncbi:MAG: hypothetical protein KatS3mg035_2111 [Bacteroidia bacterium]|nr:MAG: hypothetical protein KatS3mg035_2058 [Bacteroidia bacterium]GIV44988.1 MAG: hypothetical protein KatS3mg035_2111 [Bacteroidia bacterium]
MKATKCFSILLIFLLVSSCNLFRTSGTSSRIETEGSYTIVSQSTFSSKQGEPTSKIEGYVFDDYSKNPVSYGFVISIENDQYRTIIDSLGYFNLILPPGTYKFKFSSVGNKELVTEPIRLNENTQTQLKVYLGSDIMYKSEKKPN